MPVYAYKAVTTHSDIVQDKIEAPSEAAAKMQLRDAGLHVMQIKQENFLAQWSNKQKKVKKKELALFTKQLSYLMGTGIALHKGIEIIGEQMKNKHFRRIIMELVTDIEDGMPLSQGMSKHPHAFPEAVVFQIQAAEEAGIMQETLQNVSAGLEREAQFAKEIKGALTYPVIVILACVGILYFMMTSIVPTIANTLDSFDTELPGITQMVVGTSEIISSYWIFAVLGVAVVSYVSYLLLQDEKNRYRFDGWLLKVPLIGNLIVRIDTAKMTRVMGALLESGVPIDDTLDNISNIVSNSVISAEIEEVKRLVVDQGSDLSSAFQQQIHIPRIVIQVSKVGEESGSLPDAFINLSEQLEEEVADLLKTLTSIINPVLVVLIGAIVAVIVLAIFLPMFSLIESF